MVLATPSARPNLNRQTRHAAEDNMGTATRDALMRVVSFSERRGRLPLPREVGLAMAEVSALELRGLVRRIDGRLEANGRRRRAATHGRVCVHGSAPWCRRRRGRMRIFNVRLGLATNSSSTHSLVFLPERAVDHDLDGSRFGLEYFTAGSEETKRDYFGLLLYHNLRSTVGDDIASTVACSWSGSQAPRRAEDGDAYVDHQSVYCLPLGWDGRGLDKQFVDELRDFLLRPNLAILGGNDDDDQEHCLANCGDGAFYLPIHSDGHVRSVARKDDMAGYWTVFDRDTGTKVRFSWDNMKVAPARSSAPELVDLKITDWCNIGCDFCYQGSTESGAHASYNTIQGVAWALRHMKCFEVAIGGGEPTSYPKFDDVLALFRSNGVVPNFTTKSTAWLKDKKLRAAVLEHAGGIAFSCDTPADVKSVAAALKRARVEVRQAWWGRRDGALRAVIQHVMGSRPLAELPEFLRSVCDAGFPSVTLLGFKRTGRGSSWQPHPYDGWLGVVRSVLENREKPCRLSVGIDTALAAESKVALSDAKVPDIVYQTEEGRFSMYIDAVLGKVGPSSYCEPLRMRQLERPRYGDGYVVGEEPLLKHYRAFA